MLPTLSLPPSREYRTGTENEPINFYMNALLESRQFDILLGYFSSAAISVLSVGFAKFISSGGNVRMVVNHILSQQDKDVLINSVAVPKYAYHSPLLTNYSELKNGLDAYGEHFFECLAYLLAHKRISIKIIKPKGKGIAHYKSGIFSDGENSIRFKASCNFTSYGLLENLEELNVRCSWDDDISRNAIKEQNEYFEEIYSGNADFVEYLTFEDIEAAIQRDFGDKDINELLVQEAELVQKKAKAFHTNTRLKADLEKAEKQIRSERLAPRFPYPTGAREYQKEAYNNWVNNDYSGIFAMATGTGKTITALNCLLNEYHKTGVYQAVILVPTGALVEQWIGELDKFNMRKNILSVSSKSDWQKPINNLLSDLRRDKENFVIVCTYASFYRDKFQYFFKQLPKETLFIADEAHNIGFPKVLAILPSIHLQKRIGLSATPKRIYDEEGSTQMEDFFKDKDPYVYSFSMEKAIKEGVLCEYYYFPHIVELTDMEYAEYMEISKKLAKLFTKDGDLEKKKIAEMLLLKRKRIIHKAENKLDLMTNILSKHFDKHGNLDYTFVYVPEGNSTYDNELDDEGKIEPVSFHLIDQYSAAIESISRSIKVVNFTGETPNKSEILERFANGKINVLTSMKCLDEGVDVPKTQMAIFCSSTGNPRQFIQRRGRVLRVTKDGSKHRATIHDLIVVPKISDNSECFSLEKSLVTKELERVVNFAFMAENTYEARESIRPIEDHYQLNIHTIHESLND
jgi:superfamily II DNA or RNA helicase